MHILNFNNYRFELQLKLDFYALMSHLILRCSLCKKKNIAQYNDYCENKNQGQGEDLRTQLLTHVQSSIIYFEQCLTIWNRSMFLYALKKPQEAIRP